MKFSPPQPLDDEELQRRVDALRAAGKPLRMADVHPEYVAYYAEARLFQKTAWGVALIAVGGIVAVALMVLAILKIGGII